MNAKTNKPFQPTCETLEARDVPSVSSLWFSGTTLVVKTNDVSTGVEVRPSGSNVVIQEVGTARSWSYAASTVGTVEFQGGAGNDRFVNNARYLPTRAFGFGGNDYLEGYDGADAFVGGAGNDTLVGYGGNDSMWGGSGNDVLLGMAGNDQLYGEDGNDRLNGGAGNDSMWGGNGDDVLIAIDAGTGDTLQGDAGRDVLWVDRNGSATDRTYGVVAEDKVQQVAGFANGADRTLDGDRIADPVVKSGHTYRRFANNPLFPSTGPGAVDIGQNALGDCWLLAGLGAIAQASPHTLRQYVVDFDDGTYGVRLGSSFYRVDNDLPVATATSTTPVYAGLGRENCMWAAVVEKAFTHYRRGANTYASIEGGWSIEVNRAFGSTAAGARALNSFSSAAALANELYLRWSTGQAPTIGFLSVPAGVPLVSSHMYTVMAMTRNAAGVVTSVTLRNPWGVDGGGNRDSNPNDGFVTVTPAQLFRCLGEINWGRV